MMTGFGGRVGWAGTQISVSFIIISIERYKALVSVFKSSRPSSGRGQLYFLLKAQSFSFYYFVYLRKTKPADYIS